MSRTAASLALALVVFASAPAAAQLLQAYDHPGTCSAEATVTVHIRTPATLADSVLVPNDELWDTQWALKGGSPAGTEAKYAWWSGTDCTRKIVAVIDTGFDAGHPDLRQNLWINPDEFGWDGLDDDGNGYADDVHGWDFADRDANVAGYSNVCDFPPRNGYTHHGTSVAGVIGAVGDNQIGIASICWDAQIMVLKAARCTVRDGVARWGFGTSAYMEALAYAAANGAEISNNSYGGRRDALSPMESALFDDLAAQGHVVVAAAGNDGYNVDHPGNPLWTFVSYPQQNILGAGSLLPSGDYDAPFSNWGTTSVDIAAPGDSIAVLGIHGVENFTGYGESGGTSFASPHVAGALALSWSLHPALTWSEARSRVLTGAVRRPELENRTRLGRQLNLHGAVIGVGRPICGLNIELAVVMPILHALWRRRRRAR